MTVTATTPTTTTVIPVTTTAPITTTSIVTTTAPVTTTPPVTTVSAEEKVMLDAFEKYGAVGMSVAIIDGGEVTDTYQYGWAVKELRLMDENTKIRAASISKVIVTMLAMRLAEEGKLDIDAPLSDYVGVPVVNPKYPDIPITTRHILCHVSSLANLSYVGSWDEMVARFSELSSYTSKKPGDSESFSYCNYAFGVLGTILEKIVGKPLAEYADDTVFKEVGVSASFHNADFPSHLLAELYKTRGRMGLSLMDQTGYV